VRTRFATGVICVLDNATEQLGGQFLADPALADLTHGQNELVS